jgi:hypothetical protein
MSNNMNNSKPIFILGTQRSGTTLLTRALSAHPEVFIQNEISVDKVFRYDADKAEILSNIDKEIQVRHHQGLDKLLSSQNKKIWGIKDPQLTEHLGALRQFLPECKFIIIVRDGRGVVNSYIDNKWGLGTNAYTGAHRWHKEVSQQKQLMAEYPESFILIRYEDLVTDMETQVKKACIHIGVDFKAEMLTYFTKKAQFKEHKSNINTNKKPDVNIAEKWRKELSIQQISLVEYVATKELVANGYPLCGKKIELSTLQKYYYETHQVIIGEIQIQYQLKKILIKQKIKLLREKH